MTTNITPSFNLISGFDACNDQSAIIVGFWIGKIVAYSPDSSVRANDLYKKYQDDISTLVHVFPKISCQVLTRNKFYRLLRQAVEEGMIARGGLDENYESNPRLFPRPAIERRTDGMFVRGVYADFSKLTDSQPLNVINQDKGGVLRHEASNLNLEGLFIEATIERKGLLNEI